MKNSEPLNARSPRTDTETKDITVKESLISLLILLHLVGLLAGQARADLAAYLKKPEPAYRWEKRGEERADGGTIYDLHLVSQVWQGITWTHRVQIFRPDNIEHPHFCTLLNTGGNGGATEKALGMTLAKGAGTVFAILYNIPNQPLYGGKVEDALVVYTWLKYMETGDESWPLHFPMAKAVLKSMDAIQAFFQETKLPPIEGFLVTGASKRGWTAWLVGASRDPRVKAIAPMVIDTLNIPAQLPHHLEAFGGVSEQIDDYTNAGVLEKLSTPQGKRLLELEDPYSYRHLLTLPKLLINGTNDRYWAQDALNLYWDGLKGPKWVLYVPNSGHGLEDRTRVYNALSAFARAIAGKRRWPKMRWAYQEDSRGASLFVGSDIAPKSAHLFRTYALTKDFRDSKWSSEPMTPAKGSFTGRLDAPLDGYAALFGEAVYEIDGKEFTLSTQIKILPGRMVGMTEAQKAAMRQPPPDAVVLFNGTDLAHWVHRGSGRPATWTVSNGEIEIKPGSGDILTKERFSDFQLHLEFNVPYLPGATGQARGNSGVYLHGLYEIQVLDSYRNPTYAKGGCGAIYGQKDPDFRACKPPNEWQTYDITFRAPRFGADGKVVENPRITVLHNGVKIHDNVEIKAGPTTASLGGPLIPTGPILLQDHGHRVRYRNIWIRPLKM